MGLEEMQHAIVSVDMLKYLVIQEVGDNVVCEGESCPPPKDSIGQMPMFTDFDGNNIKRVESSGNHVGSLHQLFSLLPNRHLLIGYWCLSWIQVSLAHPLILDTAR